VADEKLNPIPVGSGETTSNIKTSHTTLRGLIGESGVSGNLEMAVASAPSTHRQADNALRISASGANMGQIEPQPEVRGARVGISTAVISTMMARGDKAWDHSQEKAVVVLRADVARTKKNTPIHKVVDKEGNRYLVSEKKLQKLQRS
jgi:hypothetical protein